MLTRLLIGCLAPCASAAIAMAGPDWEKTPRTGADDRSIASLEPVTWAAMRPTRTSVYRLESDSTYRNGCFDPCDCVLDLRSSASGTMVLTRVPSIVSGTRRYEVSDVNWRIMLGGSDVLVRGRGVYTWYASLGALQVLAHRLELDLRVGEGSDPFHFDSELVAGASDGEFPPIHIVIDMNNQVCTDQVFTLNATPVAESTIVGYRLDGDAFYQEGCLAPCLCPIMMEQPVGGSLALVPLPSRPETPRTRDWGVIRIAWRPTVSITPVDAVTRGSGFYSIGSNVADPVSQRMLVALTRPGSAEAEYDSGWVGISPLSSSLPPHELDVTIADNGFFRYNRVYGVSATR